MKKVVLLAAATVVLAAAAAVAIHANRQANPVFEANVEALTRQEGGLFGPMCTQTGTPGSYRMKRCSDCDGMFGDYALDVVAWCINYLNQ